MLERRGVEKRHDGVQRRGWHEESMAHEGGEERGLAGDGSWPKSGLQGATSMRYRSSARTTKPTSKT